MVAFYWARASAALGALMRAAGLVYTVPLLIAAILVFFNPEIAQAVGDWNGVSRWWAILILAALVLYALAHGHYERTTQRENAASALEERVESLEAPEARPSQTGFDIRGAGNVLRDSIAT